MRVSLIMKKNKKNDRHLLFKSKYRCKTLLFKVLIDQNFGLKKITQITIIPWSQNTKKNTCRSLKILVFFFLKKVV